MIELLLGMVAILLFVCFWRVFVPIAVVAALGFLLFMGAGNNVAREHAATAEASATAEKVRVAALPFCDQLPSEQDPPTIEDLLRKYTEATVCRHRSQPAGAPGR
jgi:hypothetical protein